MAVFIGACCIIAEVGHKKENTAHDINHKIAADCRTLNSKNLKKSQKAATNMTACNISESKPIIGERCFCLMLRTVA